MSGQSDVLALVPLATAPVAIGLNGSTHFVGSALEAAVGGAVLAGYGVSALLPTTLAVGAISIVLCSIVRPEARGSVVSGTLGRDDGRS